MRSLSKFNYSTFTFREEKIQTKTSYLSQFSSHLIGCFDLSYHNNQSDMGREMKFLFEFFLQKCESTLGEALFVKKGK